MNTSPNNNNLYKQLVDTARLFSMYNSELRKQFINEALPKYIHRVSPQIVERLLKKKFNHSQMQILNYVAQKPDLVATYQEVVQAMPFSQGLVSRYVKFLATNGLLIKFHQPTDLKSVLLKITDVGQSVSLVCEEIHNLEIQYYEQLLSQLPIAKVTHTLEVLEVLMGGDKKISLDNLAKTDSVVPGHYYKNKD
ncbi:hypothetical protein [Veillonella sp. R32]|uniref:hypothetical protein n=1 Tax=Veillonella sp. R32 TaxID=2021312 RepID=UPI001389E809|nr:hypothetical protein [Veillonella sp. R32]KAF1680724.1 hypothetical protein VER_08105 [Veillonella sp. R32]